MAHQYSKANLVKLLWFYIDILNRSVVQTYHFWFEFTSLLYFGEIFLDLLEVFYDGANDNYL